MSVNLDIILYICGVITSTSAAVAIVIKLINRKITRTIEENSAIRNIHTALVSQIRYQIDTALRRARAEGHVSNYSMSALESLFEVYKVMGGNGFVESEMEEIRKINQNGGKGHGFFRIYQTRTINFSTCFICNRYGYQENSLDC